MDSVSNPDFKNDFNITFNAFNTRDPYLFDLKEIQNFCIILTQLLNLANFNGYLKTVVKHILFQVR